MRGYIMPAKQPPPIEEIIDNVQAMPATPENIKKGSDILQEIHMQHVSITHDAGKHFCFVRRIYAAMERKIATLTQDNLQLMKQIEDKGKC